MRGLMQKFTDFYFPYCRKAIVLCKTIVMLETIDALKKRDRNTVDANNKFEVEYLHLQYPWYTYQQIKDVIKTAGPLYNNIERELSLKHISPAGH